MGKSTGIINPVDFSDVFPAGDVIIIAFCVRMIII